MKYLFIFAHPDDETVGCGGTIKRLVEKGDEVSLAVVTWGDAGQVMEAAQESLKQSGSVGALRKAELEAACKQLGVAKLIPLEFKDGEINNKQVWGELREAIIEQIDSIKPEIVVTFDHTGWYYHLDHVGVSIAATLAYNQSQHAPLALLHSHFQPGGQKWKYVFHKAPVTHRVLVTDVASKLACMSLHASQNLDIPKNFIQQQDKHYELYEVAFVTEQGKQFMATSDIFELIEQ